jgi:hypothetical protein
VIGGVDGLGQDGGEPPVVEHVEGTGGDSANLSQGEPRRGGRIEPGA